MNSETSRTHLRTRQPRPCAKFAGIALIQIQRAASRSNSHHHSATSGTHLRKIPLDPSGRNNPSPARALCTSDDERAASEFHIHTCARPFSYNRVGRPAACRYVGPHLLAPADRASSACMSLQRALLSRGRRRCK